MDQISSSAPPAERAKQQKVKNAMGVSQNSFPCRYRMDDAWMTVDDVLWRWMTMDDGG
jgi:hypothetical protein